MLKFSQKFALRSSLILILALQASSAMAAPKKKDPNHKINAEQYKNMLGRISDSEQKELEKLLGSKAYRSIALNEALNDNLPELAALKVFRSKFFGIRTAENLEGLIREYLPHRPTTAEIISEGVNVKDPSFDALDQNVQLAVAMLDNLMVYKSIAERMRPIFEEKNVFGGGYHEKVGFLHTAIVSNVRVAVGAMKTYLPDHQWMAILKFLTEPMDNMGGPLSTPEKVQDFVSTDVYASMALTNNRILKILHKIRTAKEEAGKRVIWDNNLYYGNMNDASAAHPDTGFRDDIDRYREVREPELLAMMALTAQSMAGIAINSAYTLTGAIGTYKDFFKLYGIEQFKASITGDIEGAPVRDRVGELNKNRNLFVLKDAGWMETALENLRAANSDATLTWNYLKTHPKSKLAVLDPALFQLYGSQIDESVKNRTKILRGRETVISSATREPVEINLPLFFTSPPPDLKAFLPIGPFVDDEISGHPKSDVNGSKLSELRKTVTAPAQCGTATPKCTIEYRNFNEGSAQHWNWREYQKYIPSVKSDAEVPNAARIMSQVLGTGIGGIMAIGIL